MPLDPYIWHELPETITKAHVDSEAANYPRPVVMLQCRAGWASYSAHDGTRITGFASWNKGLLEFANAVRDCAVQKTPVTRLTHKRNVPTLAHVEGRV